MVGIFNNNVNHIINGDSTHQAMLIIDQLTTRAIAKRGTAPAPVRLSDEDEAEPADHAPGEEVVPLLSSGLIPSIILFSALSFHSLMAGLSLGVSDQTAWAIFISILAYHLLTWVQQKLAEAGDPRDWKTLRRLLGTHSLLTTRLPLIDGRIIDIRKPSVPDAAQAHVYQLLGIDWKTASPIRRTEFKKASPSTIL